MVTPIANQIPVNTPCCPFHSFHRDGASRVDGNQGATLNHEPNSFGQWTETLSAAKPSLVALDGQTADRWNHHVDEDYYSQPGTLFRLMIAEKKELLFGNIGRHMTGVDEAIQRRLEHFRRADPAYADGVAKALSLK